MKHEFDTKENAYIPMCFNTQNNTFLMFVDKTTDKSNNQVKLFNIRHCHRNPPAGEQRYSIAYNPKFSMLVRLFGYSDGRSIITYKHPNAYTARDTSPNQTIFDAQFSLSNNWLICNTSYKGILFFHVSNEGSFLDDHFRSTNSPYASMQFLSNNIIALLSHNNIIEYWSNVDKKCIATITCLQNQDEPIIDIKRTKRLSFSPDSKKLLVALQNKCFIIPVPFYVKYMPKTMQKLFFYFSLLVHISHALDSKGQPHESPLPKEIVLEIIEKMLPFYERP